MSRKNWKSFKPISLMDAMRAAKDCAQDRKNLSVERIADLLAVTPDVLYKWLASGRMPAAIIPMYEMVTGTTYVSTYLSNSAGKLVLDLPRGMADAADVQMLQATLHQSVGAIMAWHQKKSTKEETLAAILAGMEALAWHHGDVEKFEQPELDLS